MSTKYRFKFYAVRGTRTGGPYIVLDDIWMRTTPGGSYINTTTDGTATGFSQYNTSTTPAHALVDMGASWWHSASVTQATMTAGNAWWQYDFTADYIRVKEYKFKLRNDIYWQQDSPITWNFEWYNDRTGQWVIIDSQVSVSWTEASQERIFTVNYSGYASYTGRNNLTSNTNYVFRTTESGIHVYNSSYSGIGFISIGDLWLNDRRFNCVYANDTYLYIGTNISGVERSPISSIAIGVYDNILPYKQYPNISSDEVLDIHGYDDYLCVITNSGIDEINTNTDARYYTTVSGASRCFQTASGIYYLISGTLSAVYNLTSNWSVPDYSYNEATHPSLFNVEVMNDLHVRDGVIYLATNNGIIIIKEERGSEDSSDYKRFKEI